MRALSAILIAACLAIPAVAATPASNRSAAESDTSALLASVKLPDGTASVAQEPVGDGGALADAAMKPVAQNLVVKTAFFRSTTSPADVLAYVRANPPAGTTLGVSGSGDTTDGRHVDFVGFKRPAISHVLSTRQVIVAVVPLDDGSTGVRVDAEALWLTPRPAASLIRGAHFVTINVGKHAITVASRAEVKRLVGLVNDAEFQTPGAVISCPNAAVEPAHPRLTFRTRRGGRVLGYLHVRPTGCARGDLVVGGRRYEALDLAGNPGAKLLDELRRLGVLPETSR